MKTHHFLAYEGDAPVISVSVPPELSAGLQRFAEALSAYGQIAQQAAIVADEFHALMRVLTARPSHVHIHRALARGAAHKRKQTGQRA